MTGAEVRGVAFILAPVYLGPMELLAINRNKLVRVDTHNILQGKTKLIQARNPTSLFPNWVQLTNFMEFSCGIPTTVPTHES